MLRANLFRAFWAPAIVVGLVTGLEGQAGGPVVYENGSPDMGSSYAGAGARAQDAATVFTNPAGMTRLQGNQLILGVMGVFSDFELDLNSGTVTNPQILDGGGRQNNFSPGLGSFAVFELAEDWRVGLSINALAANGVDYDPSWAGRTFVTENFFTVANFQPSLAYRINEWISVGTGLNIVYGKLDQELRADDTLASPTVKIEEADDWQVGGTFSALFEPVEGTRVGLVYRTEIGLELDGSVEAPVPVDLQIDTDFDLPQGLNLSLYQELTPEFAILGDLGWTDWSTFTRQPLSVGPIAGGIDRDFEDTYRVGIGLQYRPVPAWTLRTGFSFDSSPSKDKDTLPDLPVGDQYRFSIGAQHDFGEGKVFGVSYTALYSDIEIDRVALPPGGTVVIDGDYDRALVHFIGLTVSIDF